MKHLFTCVLVPVIAGVVVAAENAEKEKKPVDPFVAALAEPIIGAETARTEIEEAILKRIPALTCPERAEDWTATARDLRQRILDEVVYRGTPAEWIEAKPKVKWLDTIDTAKGYRIRKLLYEGYPGLWIPALLYEPAKLSGKVPVVYNTNGHVGAEGKAIDYKQIRCINLAKRGILALNPEWIGMGQLSGVGYSHHRLAYLDLCGRSGLGVFFMSMKRGLDVLCDHPNADRERVGVTGLSGGGWQTIIISSLDERVRLCAPNAGYSGLEPRVHNDGDVGDLEQNPSDLIRIADYSHLTAMLAPRPALLIYNEKDNCCFATERAKPSVYTPVIPFYKLFKAEDSFAFHNNKEPGTHNYDLDNRQQFYRFANRHWLPADKRVDDEIKSDDEVRTKDELSSPLPEDNATFPSLALAAAKSLPKQKLPAVGKLNTWQERGRAALSEVLRYKRMTGYGSEAGGDEHGDYQLDHYEVQTDEWTLPAIVLSKPGAEARGMAVVVTDEGRGGAADLKRKLADKGFMVASLDVLFVGECKARPKRGPGFVGQMVGTVGLRPLGIQAAQILAAARLGIEEYNLSAVTLVGVGRTSSVVALAAAALEPDTVKRLITVDLPASLKLLIEENDKYDRHPSLFCFGLLEQFDVREMLAMVAPRQVDLLKTAGGKERIDKELTPLTALWKAAGGEPLKLHRKGL